MLAVVSYLEDAPCSVGRNIGTKVFEDAVPTCKPRKSTGPWPRKALTIHSYEMFKVSCRLVLIIDQSRNYSNAMSSARSPGICGKDRRLLTIAIYPEDNWPLSWSILSCTGSAGSGESPLLREQSKIETITMEKPKEFARHTILILEKFRRPSCVKLGVPSSINDRSVR